MADAGAAKEIVEARHIAAVLTPEKGRGPVLNKDIAALSERMKKEGGKSVFQAEVADKEDDVMVNFDQMHRVMDDERKRITSETDPLKKGELQKRFDRLSLRYGIYDKLLNNEGYKSMTPEEKHDIVNIMTALPGFTEAVSIATGGRLTISQVNKFLAGKGGVLLNADERRAVNTIVEQFANSDKLQTRIAKNLAGLTMPPEDAAKAQEIETLRENIKDKDEAGIRTEIANQKTKVAVHETKPVTEKERIKLKYDGLKRELNAVSESYRPAEFSDTAFNNAISDIDSKVVAMAAARGAVGGARVIPPFTPIAHGPTTDPYAAERTEIANLEDQKSRLTRLKTSMRGDETNLNSYADALNATARIRTLEADLKQIDKDKAMIAAKEGERSVYADKYKRKMETALPEEMKRFWNDVVITNAVQAANAEIMMKEEKAGGEKSEEQKREDTAKGILDKYLKLAFLKYKNGKVAGFDDKAIKDFMHKDMLSRSPSRLTRDMIEKIYYNSGNMPDAYRKELKGLLTDMGVGKGNPPLSLRDALNKIPQSWYENMAAQKVPEMLGYAWGRGYYFDRMKLKGGEAEFLRQAYPPEFFEKAFEARQAEFDTAQKMLDDHILGGDAVTKEQLKKIFGKDWTQGMKRAMKVAAVAGAVGAGVFVAGGGLATRGPFVMADAVKRVTDTLINTAATPVALGRAVSSAGYAGINAANTEVQKGANWVTQQLAPNP